MIYILYTNMKKWDTKESKKATWKDEREGNRNLENKKTTNNYECIIVCNYSWSF